MTDTGALPQSQLQTLLIDQMYRLLDTRTYPKTICPSEIARAMPAAQLSEVGVTNWRELMTPIRAIAWDARANGHLEIMQRGRPLSDDARLEDISGPIRLRRIPHD